MTTPNKPPRTKFLTKSLTTGLYDLSSLSSDTGSADRNTSKPCLKVRSQSVNQGSDRNPLPGSDLHLGAMDSAPCPGLSSNTTTENRAMEDDQSPCSDRPPPIPPKSKTVISRISSTSANSGDYDTLKTSHVKPSHPYENVQRPPRPLRPEQPSSHTLSRSPSGFDTMPPQLELLLQSNNQNREDQQGSGPVRQPPVPPKSKAVISRMSPASANGGDYDNLKTPHVKPQVTNGERVPPPLPPPRSAGPPPCATHPPSSVYERTLPQKELLPKPSESRYEDVQRSPRPPRPERPPSLARSRSPSGFKTPPPQLELLTQGSEGHSYDDRAPSPVPMKTRSLSTNSLSSGPLAGYYSPRRASTGTSKPTRPAMPPPPSFNTPSPSAASRYPPSSSPSVYETYNTESLYSEIDEIDPSYLEVLPEEKEHQFQPTYSVYRPNCGSSTMTHSQSQLEPHYRNTCSGPRISVTEDMEDFESLMRWMRAVEYWENSPLSLHGLSLAQETREFNQRALHVKKGLRLFNYLLIKRNDSLRSRISELNSIADTLDKGKSKSRNMGLAAGTTGMVGVVTAITGIALAPMTMGASLVATAVGAGLVAGGGGMGISGVMHKKKNMVDRKRVEKVVDDYIDDIIDVERCLSLVRTGMDNLRRHNVCKLKGAGVDPESVRTAAVALFVHQSAVYQAVGRTTCTGGASSKNLLEAFTKTLDKYFTEKDGKLKLGTETKFAGQVRLLAQGLLEVLNELNKIWETFTCAANI